MWIEMAKRHREDRSGRPRAARWSSLVWLGLVTVALLARSSVARIPSRSPHVSPQKLPIEELTLVPGDLLFRRGRSLISRAVLAADTGSEYSHVGLVSIAGDRIWVLHTVPPEEPEKKGGAIAESLSAFLTPDKASAVAVYRPKKQWAMSAAEETAWVYVRARKPFDSGFDLMTDDALYCTELVWKSYRAAGVDLKVGPLSRGKYLLPSNLLQSPQLEKIQEIKEANNP
jgi:Permuted papain-like amidase enzyme, YaeF/YiiX, C92 family